MKINWKVRVKNYLWWVEIALAIVTPVLAYAGITAADITTWKMVGDLILSAVTNPYLLIVVVIGVVNAITDPTTAGIKDSDTAMTYTAPKKEG